LSSYPPDTRQPWLEGLGIVVRRLAEELPDRPVTVAGLPVPRDADERKEMLPQAIAAVDEARADGVDVSLLILDAGSAYADVTWPHP
ncbi:MAG: beta-glucosidase, partial [Acidimicrobiaceae bacterium]|nr:beta-glucosidase [Acidimicrobiaceae bacterium]